MRLPYSWLREVVQAGAPGWDVPPDELEQTLIRIGHEVEEVIPVGPVTGPLTVGRVAEIEELTEFKKPIRAVKVDVGEAEPRDIVCGATNFAVGDLVVVALPGTDTARGLHHRHPQDLRPHLRRDDLLGGRTPSWAPTIPASSCCRRAPPNPATRPPTCSASTMWCSTWRSPRTAATACRCAAWPAKSPAPTTSTSSTPPTYRRCPPRARPCR